MAKKVTTVIKLQLPAGGATPAPPVGPALGQHGVNIMQFVKEYNERSASLAGNIVPVELRLLVFPVVLVLLVSMWLARFLGRRFERLPK